MVAHRSGNSLGALRAAETLGARTVEADVHLFRGRLEVRHLKTLGPVPLLWDRWTLASPWTGRLLVPELLRAVAPATELVLDLKGRNRRLPERLLAVLRPWLAQGRAVTICARSWPLLEPFADVERVRLVHSVGSARQLARLRRRLGARRIEGISIHERLLDPRRVRELRGVADLILTWPVNTVERARELAGWGVDGLISDRPDLVRAETL